MKTLANCSISEFIRQAYKIKKVVEELYKVSGIAEIRKKLPDIKDKTEEEAAELLREQSMKNISEILDACLGANAEKTVELIGLICFKEGEEVETLTPADVLDVALEVLNSERVLSFFSKLANLGLISTENT